jgi:predicted DNA-binding protein (UPF0251 family)
MAKSQSTSQPKPKHTAEELKAIRLANLEKARAAKAAKRAAALAQ